MVPVCPAERTKTALSVDPEKAAIGMLFLSLAIPITNRPACDDAGEVRLIIAKDES